MLQKQTIKKEHDLEDKKVYDEIEEDHLEDSWRSRYFCSASLLISYSTMFFIIS